jgi:hypothetical protein
MGMEGIRKGNGKRDAEGEGNVKRMWWTKTGMEEEERKPVIIPNPIPIAEN